MNSVFITGANRGLGQGFAEYFLGKGFMVYAGIRHPSPDNGALHNDPHLVVVPIDVSDDGSIERAYETIRKKTDHLDFLINNAGTNKRSATGGQPDLVSVLERLDRKSLLSMFDVNAVSPVMVLKRFLPLLQVAPSFVINISSARSSYKDENENANGNYGYRASKAALNLMTFCSLYDISESVRTFAVHPGSVKTDMNPAGTQSPKEQAEAIISITERWRDEFNGKLLRYDGTLYQMQ